MKCLFYFVGGGDVDKSVSNCQQPVSANNSTQKQYYTPYFPNEKVDAEDRAKKFADEYVVKNFIRVPDKMAPPTDTDRKRFEWAHRHAYSSEFERMFKPTDYYYSSVQAFFANAFWIAKTI